MPVTHMFTPGKSLNYTLKTHALLCMSVTLWNNYVLKIVERENKQTRTDVPDTAGKAVCAPPTSAGPPQGSDSGKEHLGTLGLGSLSSCPKDQGKGASGAGTAPPSQRCSRKGWVLEDGRWPRAERGAWQNRSRQLGIGTEVPTLGVWTGSDKGPTRLGPPGLGFQDGGGQGAAGLPAARVQVCTVPLGPRRSRH